MSLLLDAAHSASRTEPSLLHALVATKEALKRAFESKQSLFGAEDITEDQSD